MPLNHTNQLNIRPAQLAEAVEYTDSISEKG